MENLHTSILQVIKQFTKIFSTGPISPTKTASINNIYKIINFLNFISSNNILSNKYLLIII